MPSMRSHAARAARRLLGESYETVRARVLGTPPPASPTREAGALRSSGLFDAQFYRRLRALPTTADAAEDYATYGSRQKLPFHPLIEPEYVGAEGLRALSEGRVTEFLAALRRLPVDRWGPLLEGWPAGRVFSGNNAGLALTVGGVSLSADAAAERLIAFHADLERPTDEITSVEWESALSSPRVDGRVSVVMLTYQDHAMTVAAVDAVLQTTEENDVEVILVDNASREAVGRVLVARYGAHPRVRYLRPPVNLNFGPGSNLGALRSSGEFLMLLNNDTLPLTGWLQPLLKRLARPGVRAVQPLLLYPDGTVQTAGTVFAAARSLAHHFLVGHPLADAVRHGGEGFRAITAGAMLIRASDFLSLRGFEPAFVNGQEDVDLCLRAARELGGCFEVESDSRVVHFESKSPGRMARASVNREILMRKWRSDLTTDDAQQYVKIGLDLAHTQPDLSGPLAIARPVAVRRAHDRVPRWSIATDIPAKEVMLGHGVSPSWDLVRDLVASIEALGHEVTVDAEEVRLRSTAYLDDVRLVLGSRVDASPWIGRCNVLVTNDSVPDGLTTDVEDGFDARLSAASLETPAGRAASLREILAIAGLPVSPA